MLKSKLIRYACGALAASVPLLLASVLVVIFIFALPSIRFNGLQFFTTLPWNIGDLYGTGSTVRNGIAAPPGAAYGVVVFVVGTLLTSFIALVLAVPVSVGSALFLTEIAPRAVAAFVGPLIELLAGVPSVVFGLWGLDVVAPAVRSAIAPFLARVLGFIPVFAGPIGTGVGLLSASIVLAVMVIPIVTAISRDVLANVPRELREQGLAMGTTKWELVRTVVLPSARNGIGGAIGLGFGRALGETMAVLMVSGSALNYLPRNLYSPVGTMAANIVALLDSAMTDATGMAVHALAEIAVVLFLITFIVNALVPIVTRGMARLSGSLPASVIRGGGRP